MATKILQRISAGGTTIGQQVRHIGAWWKVKSKRRDQHGTLWVRLTRKGKGTEVSCGWILLQEPFENLNMKN